MTSSTVHHSAIVAATVGAVARMVDVDAFFTVIPPDPFRVDWRPRDVSYRPFYLERQQFKLTGRYAEAVGIADRSRPVDEHDHGVLAVEQRRDLLVNTARIWTQDLSK